MEFKRTNNTIILILFIIGIGCCGYAYTQNDNPYDGMIPGMIGLMFLTIGVIYLITHLVSYLFICLEMKAEVKVMESNAQNATEYRKYKLIQVGGISLTCSGIGLTMPYIRTDTFTSLNLILLLTAILTIIASCWGLIHRKKIAKKIWVTAQIFLLYISLTTLINPLVDFSKLIYLFVPIGHLYVIGVLSKSKLINDDDELKG